jgi:hypothetical protein
MAVAATSSAGDNACRSCYEAAMSVAAARDRFRARMEEAFKLLVALDHALALGKNAMRQNAAAHPQSTVQSGVGPPTGQGLVIQRWYEFLQASFEALIREHLSGARASADLGKFVSAAARRHRSEAEHFDRPSDDEKLPLLARILTIETRKERRRPLPAGPCLSLLPPTHQLRGGEPRLASVDLVGDGAARSPKLSAPRALTW